MKWPLPQDFNEAVQNPAAAFSDPDLRDGEAVVGVQGLPLPYSGNFADVYQMLGPDGRNWAVKCFTRPVFGLEGRYAQVAEALTRARLRFGVEFNFLAEGIKVRGAWRPVVKMEWVAGRLLNEVVGDNAGRPAVLATLSRMWVKLCRRLRKSGITHADLQHGNVLLVPGSRPGAYGLKLIDYDGMYIPALAHLPSGEAGHPNFQHPVRIATRTYSPDLDRFPHLVVVTALKGLEVGGEDLWARYDTGDNLLFVEKDFKNPARSSVMRELWQSADPGVRALVGRLAVACGRPIPETPWLDEVAPGGELLPLDPDTTREATDLLGSPALGSVSLAVPVDLAFESGDSGETGDVVEAESVPEPTETPVLLDLGGSTDADYESMPDAPRDPPGSTDDGHESAPEDSWDPQDDDLGERAELPRRPRPVADTRRGTRRWRERRPGRKNRLPLLVGIGVFLLVGAAAGGVLLLAAKRSANPGRLALLEAARDPGRTNGPDPGVPGLGGAIATPSDPRPVTIPTLPFRWSVQTKDRVWVKTSLIGDVVFAYEPGRPVRFYSARTPNFLGEFSDGTRLWEFRPRADGTVVSWAPDQPTAVVWDPATRKVVGTVPVGTPPPVTGEMVFDVSPDSRYVVAGTRTLPTDQNPAGEGQVRVYDAQARRDILNLKVRSPQFRFTSRGELLVADVDRCFWFKLPDGTPEGAVALPSATRPVLSAISPDGGRALWGDGNRTVSLIDTRSGSVLSQFPGRVAVPNSGFSPDGRLAVVAIPADSGIAAPGSHLEVLDLQTGHPVGRFSLGKDSPPDITTAYFSADGRSVAAGRLKGSILVVGLPGEGPEAPNP
ncbi:MAG: hypothetical protein JWO38_1172 [Gemmataceae bacterium]|nr:hypothetical protein [Gemmataceae bacterium]